MVLSEELKLAVFVFGIFVNVVVVALVVVEREFVIVATILLEIVFAVGIGTRILLLSLCPLLGQIVCDDLLTWAVFFFEGLLYDFLLQLQEFSRGKYLQSREIL